MEHGWRQADLLGGEAVSVKEVGVKAGGIFMAMKGQIEEICRRAWTDYFRVLVTGIVHCSVILCLNPFFSMLVTASDGGIPSAGQSVHMARIAVDPKST